MNASSSSSSLLFLVGAAGGGCSEPHERSEEFVREEFVRAV
jgi:hypothetical protein